MFSEWSAYEGVADRVQDDHFTKHAADALNERAIEPAWVIRVVQSPDWAEMDATNSAVELRFGIIVERGGRYLRVVCIETATEIRIISAFLDRLAKPK